MKSFRKFILATIAAMVLLPSCDDYLDVVPDNLATIDYAFRDRVGAEKYLFTCYSYLPAFGSPANDPTIMGGDDIWVPDNNMYYAATGNFNAHHIKQGRQNTDNPLLDFWNGTNNGKALFRAIRDCNVFLENIDKVGPDLPNAEKNKWIAEVKFLKAYYHYYLLRMYGPIPLIKENLPISASTDEVRVYREPFDDCVDYIVQLINEAIPDLPLTIADISNELGRITQPIALCIRAELLVMAASDLFNGNGDFADMVDNRGVHLFKAEKDPLKWERAAVACKNAIDTCALAGFDRLYEFSAYRYDALSDTTKRIMSCRHVVTDRWNREIIWGDTRNNSSYIDTYWALSMPYFTQTEANNPWGTPILAPTLRMAELFYSNRGVPIDEDNQYDYANRYKTEAAPAAHKYYVQTGFETAKLHLNREPRFYANLGFDGGVWFGNGRFKDIDAGTADETSWIINMKKGQPSGYLSGIRFPITGYSPKKPIHFETARTITGQLSPSGRNTFPIFRLADIYLLYAEALNESLNAPNAEVYKYIDLVRKRAGLEGVVDSWTKYSKISSRPADKGEMRKIIRQERMIELAFEGKRFWDIRRWKTATDLLNQPIRGWNNQGTTTADYYNVVTIEAPSFTAKEYLWPIKDADLRSNGNLIQNPGW
ncbi:starch-binding protein [Bacteroidia bacterium]|nr:starch-binding protein [Bacteroidia bacterium]